MKYVLSLAGEYRVNPFVIVNNYRDSAGNCYNYSGSNPKNLIAALDKAREGDKRSLSQICRESGIFRPYWYQLENEQIYSSVSEEMIRRIEATLGVDLGVTFED